MNSTRYEIEWPENCPSDGMGGLDADAIQWGVDWRDTLPKARKCAKDAAKSSPMHLAYVTRETLVDARRDEWERDMSTREEISA